MITNVIFGSEEEEEIIPRILITAENDGNYRYLVFNSVRGRMAVRVHGNSSKTLPWLTAVRDFTFATRSMLRSKNLVVLRGSHENSHMIGPCDFYGPLEQAHLYMYVIVIEDGFPKFYRQEKHTKPVLNKSELSFLASTEQCEVKIHATWHRGDDPYIGEIKEYYATKVMGESLFPTPMGILAIDEQTVELPVFDATLFDLTPFKARLVRNDTPFSIAEEVVHHKDSFCPVSYMFESNYAQEQVGDAGGLFLETHDFCQTITPLDALASGIVMLGKWEGDEQERHVLCLIGVSIPYGYTLIIEKGCIHGDTPLKGMYLMAMTSNHLTMQTADVVFLKSKRDAKNFVITSALDEQPSTRVESNVSLTRMPIVDFGSGQEESAAFRKVVNNGWYIYNPLYRIFNPYW